MLELHAPLSIPLGRQAQECVTPCGAAAPQRLGILSGSFHPITRAHGVGEAALAQVD
jgi:hypothetical protein